MGMLGAMAGMGKGLQDFSTLMNEKSKMDWMAQQEAVKHERALSLETLRANREDTRAEKQRGFLREERIAGQEYLSTENKIKDLNEETRANRAEALAYEQLNRRDAQIDKEHAYGLQRISVEKAAQLDTAKKLSEYSMEQDITKRKKLLAETEGTEAFKSLPPEYQKLVRMQADPNTAPIATAIIAASSKTGVEFTGRDLVAFEKNTTEKWDALGKDGQKALQEELNAKEIQRAKTQGEKPHVFDVADTKAMFTGMEFKAMKDLAGNTKGSSLSGMLSGPKIQASVETTAPSTSTINMKAIDSIASDIKSGKKGITLAKVMESDEFSEAEKEAIMQRVDLNSGIRGETSTESTKGTSGWTEYPGGGRSRPIDFTYPLKAFNETRRQQREAVERMSK